MKLILLIISILLITSCTTTREIRIITQPIEIPIYQPPLPAGLNLELPRFYIVSNKKNLKEFLAKMETMQGENFVFWAYTGKSYEIEIWNIQEFRRLIKEQQALIKYYMENTLVQTWDERNKTERNKALKPTETIIYEKGESWWKKLF